MLINQISSTFFKAHVVHRIPLMPQLNKKGKFYSKKNAHSFTCLMSGEKFGGTLPFVEPAILL